MQVTHPETYITGTSYTTLYIISLIAISCSVYIIVSKNPILSVLFLIGLFLSISVYLITIGLHFLGLVYLIVYVGAVSILFLFILMLINVRISELLTNNNNSIVLAILTLLCFNFSTQDILPLSDFLYDIFNANIVYKIRQIFENIISTHIFTSANDIVLHVLKYLTFINITNSKSWDSILVSFSHVTSIGYILYTNLAILFIITSLILLLAMIGAIIITINKAKSNYSAGRSSRFGVATVADTGGGFYLASSRKECSFFFNKGSICTALILFINFYFLRYSILQLLYYNYYTLYLVLGLSLVIINIILSIIIKQSFLGNSTPKIKFFILPIGIGIFYFIVFNIVITYIVSNPLNDCISIASWLGIFEIFKYLGVNTAEFISKFSPDKMAMDSNPPGGGSSIPGGIGSSSGGSNTPSSTAQPSSESTGSSSTEVSDFRRLRNGHYDFEYGSIKKDGNKIKLFRPNGIIPGSEVDLADPRHREVADNTSKGFRKIRELEQRRTSTACLDPEVREWMLRVRIERLNHTKIKEQTEINERLLRALDNVGTGSSD